MVNCWNTTSSARRAPMACVAPAQRRASSATAVPPMTDTTRSLRSRTGGPAGRFAGAKRGAHREFPGARPACATSTRFETFAVAMAISRPIDSTNNAMITQKPSPPVKFADRAPGELRQPPLASGCSRRQRFADGLSVSAAACSNLKRRRLQTREEPEVARLRGRLRD